nr:MAG TPA: hypothetical protein [Caudoviricetes sp.]
MIFMKIKNEYELKRELNGTIYNFYSVFGLKTIMNHLEETGKKYEFNPDTFASGFVEYSDAAGSSLDLRDLISDFGYMLEGEEIDETKEPWVLVAEAIEAEGRNTVLWIQSEAVNGIVVVY